MTCLLYNTSFAPHPLTSTVQIIPSQRLEIEVTYNYKDTNHIAIQKTGKGPIATQITTSYRRLEATSLLSLLEFLFFTNTC